MGLSAFNRAREMTKAQAEPVKSGPTKEQLIAEFEAAYAQDMSEIETMVDAAIDEPVKAKRTRVKKS